jgi:hypothetical protein
LRALQLHLSVLRLFAALTFGFVWSFFNLFPFVSLSPISLSVVLACFDWSIPQQYAGGCENGAEGGAGKNEVLPATERDH